METSVVLFLLVALLFTEIPGVQAFLCGGAGIAPRTNRALSHNCAPEYNLLTFRITRLFDASGDIKLKSNESANSDKPKDRKSFKRFMQIELWRNPELESLLPILNSIEQGCRDINRLMRRISTDDLGGQHNSVVGSFNIQGEDQKKLDVIANRIMKIAICCSGKVSIVASEEDDEPCLCSDVTGNQAFTGEFAAVFDPLDGSSNIDCGLPTGSIFGVYKNSKYEMDPDPVATSKQRGSELVVAGYCLYSAATNLVITLRTGVHIFTLDDVSGEFFLTRSNVRIPRSGAIYSLNDAYSDSWKPAVRYFINDLKHGRLATEQYSQSVNGDARSKATQNPDTNKDDTAATTTQKKATARYAGALVADMHNILINGGIFCYPGTSSAPAGKLRLLYEANPLAVLVEEAGGMACDGYQRIVDMPVKTTHQRTPLFIGSTEQVSALQRYMNFFH